jgi:histone H3/H4
MIAADGTRRPRAITTETHTSTSESSHPVLQSLRESVFQRCMRSRRRVSVLTTGEWTVFIAEITARAFIIADSNKRRTLSRSDIAKALSKSDQFDFLIDVVPREDVSGGQASATAANKGKKKSDEVRPSLPVIL